MLEKNKIAYCVVFNQKWYDNIIGCFNGETEHYVMDFDTETDWLNDKA